MADTAYFLELCPARSPQATIGPAMRVGAATVHYVKNGATASYYRLGVRETFLLAQMDGATTLASIGTAYEDRFGLPLSQAGMQRILQILAARGLLAVPVNATVPAPAPLPRLSIKGWGEVYLRVADPGRLLTLLVRHLAWIDGRIATWCIALLIAGCELYAVLQHAALWQTITASLAHPSTPLIATFIGITYGSAVCHELAHGAMCTRYGGRVNDMGLMFRYLMFFPYCKLDDLVVLPHARARTVTVLAGITLNLLLLAPFVLLDLSLTGDGLARQLCAWMLVFYNASILFNLLPFMRLDGYMLASICRGRPELKEEASRALRDCLNRRAAPAWPLVAYGLSYALVTTAAIGWALWRWLHWSISIGQPGLCAVPVLIALALLLKSRQSRARAAAPAALPSPVQRG